MRETFLMKGMNNHTNLCWLCQATEVFCGFPPFLCLSFCFHLSKMGLKFARKERGFQLQAKSLVLPCRLLNTSHYYLRIVCLTFDTFHSQRQVAWHPRANFWWCSKNDHRTDQTFCMTGVKKRDHLGRQAMRRHWWRFEVDTGTKCTAEKTSNWRRLHGMLDDSEAKVVFFWFFRGSCVEKIPTYTRADLRSFT